MSNNNQEHKRLKLLSINGVDLGIKVEFTHYAKENGLTQGELLKMLWNNFQNLYIPLTTDEQKLLSKAQDISGKSIKTKLKKTDRAVTLHICLSRIRKRAVVHPFWRICPRSKMDTAICLDLSGRYYLNGFELADGLIVKWFVVSWFDA